MVNQCLNTPTDLASTTGSSLPIPLRTLLSTQMRCWCLKVPALSSIFKWSVSSMAALTRQVSVLITLQSFLSPTCWCRLMISSSKVFASKTELWPTRECSNISTPWRIWVRHSPGCGENLARRCTLTSVLLLWELRAMMIFSQVVFSTRV